MSFIQISTPLPETSGSQKVCANHADLRPALWASIDLLKTIRKSLKLSDRDFSVLSSLAALALKRDRAGDIIVFASNKTLSLKANGMEIRTLRRRLANLVESGIIRRRSSPNGKRYAHHDADGNVIAAYGFDISPLLERMQEFRERVAIEEERRAMHRVIRDRLSLLRMSFPIDSDEDIVLRTALRRSSTTTAQMEELIELFTPVNNLAANPCDLDALTEPKHLSSTDGQNDLHLQSSKQNTYERKRIAADNHSIGPNQTTNPKKEPRQKKAEPKMGFRQVVQACPEAMSFAQEKPRDWSDLYAFSRWLAPMIGIGTQVTDQAEQTLGKADFAMTLLAIVQMSGTIRNPGAYLRSLFTGPKADDYCASRLIRNLLRSQMNCPPRLAH
jgi:replication initiation protein RepC